MIIKQNVINNIIKKAQNILLEEGIVLPYQKGCILTGQAAVSLLLEELELPDNFYKFKQKLKINDIDVFKLVHYDLSSNMITKLSNPSLEYFSSRYHDWIGKDGDRHKVVGTIKHGMMNLTNVYFDYNITNDLFAKELISKFDTNCTQFAIELDSKKAYWTKAFEDFLETGFLKITDLKTPGHTAIRFVDKAYSHGFNADISHELEKIAALGESLYTSRLFGVEMQDKFEKYSDVLKKYFDYEDVRFSKKQKHHTFRLKIVSEATTKVSEHLKRHVDLDQEILLYSELLKKDKIYLHNFNKANDLIMTHDNNDINTVLKEVLFKLYDIYGNELIDLEQLEELKQTVVENIVFGKDIFFQLENFSQAFEWNEYIKESPYKMYLSTRLKDMLKKTIYEIDTLVNNEMEITNGYVKIGESEEEPLSSLMYCNSYVVELSYNYENNTIQMLCFNSQTKDWEEINITYSAAEHKNFKAINEVKLLKEGEIKDPLTNEIINEEPIAF